MALSPDPREVAEPHRRLQPGQREGGELSAPRRLNWLARFQIRLCVGSSTLPCGCSVGRYLTFSDRLLQVIDARGHHCAIGAHAAGAVLAPPGPGQARGRAGEAPADSAD